MTTLAQLQTDLPVLLSELLGVPCDWRAQPRGMHVGARAQIDIITISGLGIDEPVWADLPALPASATEVQATVHGLRELTLQVSVSSPTQSLATSARSYLEQLRLRLSWPSVSPRLSALGLALVRVERVVQIDPQQDVRMASEASMDLRLAFGVSEADAPIPYIETAHITSAALGVDLTVPEP